MKNLILLFALTLLIISCKNDDDSGAISGCTDENSLNYNPAATVDDGSCEYPQEVPVAFSFSQNWDGEPITNADYETTEYTNEHGEILTLSKLVYLISDIEFVAADGTIYTAGDYNLIDARNGTGINFTPNVMVPEGPYEVRFTFGFDDEDNAHNYPDLNSADGGWNVPLLLGGGYHYMRMEGKYTSNVTGPNPVNFQYHTIRAANPMVDPILLTDTSFEVSLGQLDLQEGTSIEIAMNVSEWFKNPNTWDLTQLYTMLMPNYNAQIMMSENGEGGVFSLGTVTP